MRKRFLIGILMILALIMCVSTVSAAVSVTNTFDKSNPTIGGESQKASNPNADDDADKNIYANSLDIMLASDSATAVDVASVSFNYNSGFSSTDLDLTIVGDLPTGITDTTADKKIVINGRIPEELDAVDSDVEKVAVKVAEATITLSDSSTSTFSIYMERENMLNLDDVDIVINEDSESLDDGDSVDEIEAGDKIEIKISAENEYDEDDDDVDMKSVKVYLEFDDSDADDAFDVDDDEISIGTIKSEETEDETIKMDVEDDAEDEEYDAEIGVYGDDEHGAQHGEKIKFSLEIERETYDFVIKSTSLSPSVLTCSRNTELSVKVESRGDKGDDEIAVYVKNSELGIDMEYKDLELDAFDDDDNDMTKRFSITVPEDAAAKTYTLTVKVYYSGDEDDGVHADEKDIDLVVQECQASTTTTDETTGDTTDVDVVEDEDIEDIEIPEDILDEFITESTEGSFTDSTAFLVLLMAGVAGLFIVMILLIVVLIKK